MAIEHCDNFSIYGGGDFVYNLTNGVYAEYFVPTVNLFLASDPDGLSSGHVLSLAGGNNAAYLRYVMSSSQTTFGQACRIWLTQIPSNSSAIVCIFNVRDTSNTVIARGQFNTVGGIDIYNSAGTKLGGSSGPVVTANGWWHIESKIVINGASSSVEVRVEGATVVSLTGINLGTSPIAQCALYNNNNGGGTSFTKDLVWWNGSGSHNTDFLGSVIVAMLSPSADVALNWTPTGGSTGAGILDNIPPQDGVQYLTALNPPPAAYVCSLTDLVADVTSVKCIMTMVRAQKTDGGDASLQIGVISDPSGTPATVLGANRP